MLASIIIPTYNRSDVIIRSLETWAEQNLPATEFEVIVVDNNSTDNSAQLIQDFVVDKPTLAIASLSTDCGKQGSALKRLHPAH